MKKFVVCTNLDYRNLCFMQHIVFEKDYYLHERDFIATAADIWDTWPDYVTYDVMDEAQVNTLKHTITF